MSEIYFVGGDTDYELEPPKILGQTFSPLVDHQLEFVDLQIKRTTIGGQLRVTIHDLADDPNMVGGGISRGYKFTLEKGAFYEFRRARVKMKKAKLYVGHTYGLCIHHTPDPWWNKYKAQYDADDAVYPRGQRFTKDSLLDPPTYYPNDDLLFAEFGRPVAPPEPSNPPPNPPPTPPDPPIENWLITQTTQERTTTGEKFVLFTNTPCHLWMRWTLIEPKIHLVPVMRRGIQVNTGLYFCFDVYHDNEQEEPADTLAHTFIKEPWPYCEKRWYYFHGEINGTPSKSTSPVFAKHPIAPLVPPGEWHFFSQGFPSGITGWWGRPYRGCTATDALHVVNGGFSHAVQYYVNTSTRSQQIYRAYKAFDTSAIPPDASILEAYLKVHLYVTKSDWLPASLFFRNGMPTFPHHPIVANDYDSTHYLECFAGGPYDPTDNDTIVQIDLGPSGIASINKGGTTKWQIRLGADINCRTPDPDPKRENKLELDLTDTENLGLYVKY